MRKKLLGLLSIIFVALLVVACGDKTFNVEFDLNGGTSAAIEIQKVKEGSFVEEPANPSREGYTFEFWVEQESGDKWIFDTKVKEDLILVAQWEIMKYEVSFDVRGGALEIDNQTINHGSKVTKPTNPTKEGNVFKGWFEVDATVPYDFNSEVKGNLELEARWDLDEYTVSFNTFGGAPVPADQIVEYGSKALEPAQPVLDEYIFLGWYFNNELYDFDTPVKGNVQLVAKWEIVTYTVSFDLNGGTPEMDDIILEVNSFIQRPANPTKPGYIFDAWYVNDQEFNFNTRLSADITLEARWEVNYEEVLADVKALYADTLDNVEWKATEDVTLIEELYGVDVTWNSKDVDYFTHEGVVNRPTFTEGDKMVELSVEVSPVHTYIYYFLVEALEESVEEKIDEALRVVTIVPASPSGFQETNFNTLTTYTIDGEEVDVTWETSDPNVMTNKGVLVPFGDATEKEVTLTAKITYEGVTREKSITFLVQGVTAYDSFLTALVDENKDERVLVQGVTFYSFIKANEANPNGYYIASEDNIIAFVYGSKPAELKEGKLYDVIFEVDIFFGTFQLKNPAFSNERDGDLPEITPVELTLDELVNLPKPLDLSFNQTLTILKNVKVVVENKSDNYGTFFVDQSLADGTTLTDKNSIMLYYVSNMEVIQGLDGLRIDEVLVINNGYRTNNVVWYVNYIGDGSDIIMSDLTDEEKVDSAFNQLQSLIPFKVYDEKGIELPETLVDTTITWDSDDLDVIDATGKVTLPVEAKVVKLTATITIGEEEMTFERDVWVGSPEQLEATNISEIIEFTGSYDLTPFKAVGVISGISGNGTYTLEDASGALAVYSSTKLDVGFEYTIVGVKDVYNGLVQLRPSIDSVKGDEKPLPEAITLTEANLKDSAFMKTVQSHLVSINQAEVVSVNRDNYNNTTMVLKVGDATIDFRWDSRVAVEGGVEELNSVTVGDLLKITAAPVGWFNGPQIAFNNASQIEVVIPDTDAGIVDAAYKALDIPSVTKVDITLPTDGKFGSTIAWESDNPAAIDNTGKVTLQDDNVTVRLVATVSKGDVSVDYAFYVLVQVDETKLNVALARKEAKDTEVVLEGIVTGLGGDRYVYVSDPNGTSIPLFQPVKPTGLAVGDYVEVDGAIDIYNGFVQVGFGATMKIKETGLPVPAAVELDKIPTFTVDDQAKRYNVENLLVVSVNARTMIVTDGEKTITVYVDPENSALNTYLLGAVDKKVDLVGIHLGWFNNAQFLMHEEANVVIKELTDLEKAEMELMSLELPSRIIVDDKLNLPVVGPIHGQDIVWSSDNVEVIAVDGTVVMPAEELTVKLTATITVGDDEVTYNFDIIVDPNAADELEVTLVSPSIGGNLPQNENIASSLGASAATFDIRAIKGTPNGNIGGYAQLRLYSHRQSGDGNTLSVSIGSNGRIVGVKFVFVKANNASNAGLLKLGEDEIQLSEADLQTTKIYTDLDITEFSLQNKHEESGDINGQIHIVEIVINYFLDGEAPVEPEEPEEPEVPEDAMPIADFLELNQGGKGVIEGVITNVGPYNSFSMEDESGAVAFRIGGKNASNAGLNVGDLIIAEVKKNEFGGLIQAELDGEYVLLSPGNQLPPTIDLEEEELTNENLKKFQSHLIKLMNMEVTAATTDEHGNVNLTLKRNDGQTITLRWDERVEFSNNEQMLDFKVGDMVNVNGATLSWATNPRLMVDNIDQITINEAS